MRTARLDSAQFSGTAKQASPPLESFNSSFSELVSKQTVQISDPSHTLHPGIDSAQSSH